MEWYLKCLKQYFDFNGRARRKEYWMFFLFNIIIAFTIGMIEGFMEFSTNSDLSLLSLFYELAVLVPTISVAIRRMHDVGKSGWFILIPIYNLILAIREGDKGANEYGPDPKQSNL